MQYKLSDSEMMKKKMMNFIMFQQTGSVDVKGMSMTGEKYQLFLVFD